MTNLMSYDEKGQAWQPPVWLPGVKNNLEHEIGLDFSHTGIKRK